MGHQYRTAESNTEVAISQKALVYGFHKHLLHRTLYVTDNLREQFYKIQNHAVTILNDFDF